MSVEWKPDVVLDEPTNPRLVLDEITAELGDPVSDEVTDPSGSLEEEATDDEHTGEEAPGRAFEFLLRSLGEEKMNVEEFGETLKYAFKRAKHDGDIMRLLGVVKGRIAREPNKMRPARMFLCQIYSLPLDQIIEPIRITLEVHGAIMRVAV